MTPSAAEVRDATLRVGAPRAQQAIVDDLRACSRLLANEVGAWNHAPNVAALTTAETTIEGCRRLAQELRLALANERRALAEAR